MLFAPTPSHKKIGGRAASEASRREATTPGTPMREPPARLAGPPSRYGGPAVKPTANYFNENVSPVVNRCTRGVDSSRWTKNVR